ncbi:MAG: tetratricopeptide repeat protein, partial [Nitrospinota bacterium]|nr:tetratricopeptide repeat protein [Nitrospinota bacterium]
MKKNPVQIFQLGALISLAGFVAACAAQSLEVGLAVESTSHSQGTADSYFYFISAYEKEFAGKMEEAEADYENALKRDPSSASLLARLASLKVRLGKIKEAEHLAREAVRIDPANSRGYLLLGGVLAARGDLP